MNLIISNASQKPIYEQLYDQFRALILRGELNEGDSLPSIRALAKDLRISVITTKRAYDELEHDGFVNTVAGKGCFVAAKNVEQIRETEQRKLEEHVQAILAIAKNLHMSNQEIKKYFEIGEEKQ